MGAAISYAITPKIAVALAPRVTFGVLDNGEGGATTQLDVMARVEPTYPLPNGTVAYTFGALGYSRLFPPSIEGVAPIAPAGLAIGLGGGFRFPLQPRLFLGLEAGYQLGLQGGREMGVDYTFSTDLLHVGVTLSRPL